MWIKPRFDLKVEFFVSILTKFNTFLGSIEIFRDYFANLLSFPLKGGEKVAKATEASLSIFSAQ